MDIMNLPRLGPFVGISADKKITFEDLPGRTFRLIIYGAYDAFGLIGSECNGIAVLDEDKLEVVCDEISRTGTGYCGPSQKQISAFAHMQTLSWNDFRNYINDHPRSRFTYHEDGTIDKRYAAAGGR